MSIITIGHLNSDTDSVAGAVALAELLKLQGKEALAYRNGQLNKESEWALKHCDSTNLVSEFSSTNISENQEFFLVDFNEENQSPVALAKINLVGLIDHHKLNSCWKTDKPIYFRIEPVGSTCTLIAKLYQERKIVIAKDVARLLLCGLISDTINLTSPSTTADDREILTFLATQTNENIEWLAQNLFEAKSDLSSFTPEEVVRLDYKIFNFAQKKIGIGVIETLSPANIKKIEPELKQAMRKIKSEDGLDYLYLGIVDIVKQETEMLAEDEEEKQIILKAFSDIEIASSGDNLLLKTIVSRKKQIVPQIENFLKNYS